MKKAKKILKIQASSVSRVLKCPASAHLELKLKDKYRYFAYKDAAEYGTLCHKYAEELLRGGVTAETQNEIVAHPRKEEIEYTAKYYADVVGRHLIELGDGVKKISIEEKTRLTTETIEYVSKGDCRILVNDGVYAFDLKTGRFDYSESATEQMFFGEIVNLCKNRTTSRAHDDYKIVIVTVQPNYYDDSQRVIKREFIVNVGDDLLEKYRAVVKMKNVFNCADHCKFCPSILICPEVQKIIKGVFEMAKKATKEDLIFADLYKTKPAVEAFYDANENYIKTQIEAGKIIPGIGLEEYSGHRKWVDVGLVKDKLAYLGNKIFEPMKLKTPAQIEKLAGKENIIGLYETPRLKKVAIRDNPFEEA